MDEGLDNRAIESEIEKLDNAIECYSEQLDAISGALKSLSEENQQDDVSRQIAEYQGQCQRDPKNIPAEDALDIITRAENTLKIIQRRNAVLGRENATQEKMKRDRMKELNNVTTEHDMIVQKTGWWDKFDMDFTVQDQVKMTIHEMRELEQRITKELQGAKLIIRKKEQLVLDLQKEWDEVKEQHDKLSQLHNDIRVRERDCTVLKVQIDRLLKDDSANDRALAVVESSKGSTSLMFMQGDKEFLRDTVDEVKSLQRRQDAIVRAQIQREEQLHNRLEAIMISLREMRLGREYERNVSKSALVPSSSREEPTDVSQVLPEDEVIPINLFRLIYKNNEFLQTNIARKNMLVLEKEGATQAMEAKLAKYVDSLSLSIKEQEKASKQNDLTKVELMGRLQEKHREYRSEIDRYLTENAQLKAKLYKMPYTPSRRSSMQKSYA